MASLSLPVNEWVTKRVIKLASRTRSSERGEELSKREVTKWGVILWCLNRRMVGLCLTNGCNDIRLVGLGHMPDSGD